jgi:oligopeptide/dipeptide ABC transporter ATP-binding protein
MRAPVLEVRDLAVHFRIGGRLGHHAAVRAVDGVDLAVAPGETLGIAGESGCGKSTLARAIVLIVPPTRGTIRVENQPVTGRAGAARVRRALQMVFQDPQDSLNPRVKVGAALDEALMVAGVRLGDRPARVRELLETVGLPAEFARRYPHELSGGQRQRVGIARALGAGPRLIVADEPVSALDVSVRAQILNLMRRLQHQYQLGYLFISHDMATLRQISHRVGVMYLGRLVEEAATDDLYRTPLHPYTQALLASVPVPDPQANRTRLRVRLPGEVPSPVSPPPGCVFHPRCPIAQARCREEPPGLREVQPGHWVRCHFPDTAAWTKGGVTHGA